MNRQYRVLECHEEEPQGRRRQLRILPAGIHKETAGYSGMQVACTREQAGVYTVAGTPGWNVYVGIDAPADLTAAPIFTDTLPYQVATTPPVSGTKTYNVVVRAVNQYGLESQNQQAYSFVIDSVGSLVPATPAAPVMLMVTLASSGIRVLAMDPAFTKAVPSQWRLWVKATAPDTGVDAVTQTATADNPMLRPIQTGSLAPGLWHVALAIYRAGVLSEAARTTITVPAALPAPITLP